MRAQWLLLAVVCCTAAVGSLIGCGASKDSNATRHDVHDGHDHSVDVHPHTGPHGGQLIELGQEEYHAELLHDDKNHRVSIFILDESAKKPVAIGAPELAISLSSTDNPQRFKLPAVTQAGELRGTASLFQLEDEDLCKALDDPRVHARLRIDINGKQYNGVLEESEHHKHQ